LSRYSFFILNYCDRLQYDTEATVNTVAHQHMKSNRNIVIERSWKALRERLGDNIALHMQDGPHMGYDRTRDSDIVLFNAIWLPLLQIKLNEYSELMDNAPVQKQWSKDIVEKVAPRTIYIDPFRYCKTFQGVNVDREVIADLLTDHINVNGDSLQFPQDEAIEEILRLYIEEHRITITLSNAWTVFSAIKCQLQ
jgi:hypothetical protein